MPSAWSWKSPAVLYDTNISLEHREGGGSPPSNQAHLSYNQRGGSCQLADLGNMVVCAAGVLARSKKRSNSPFSFQLTFSFVRGRKMSVRVTFRDLCSGF